MSLENIFTGTSYGFDLNLLIDNEVPNVVADTVTLRLKRLGYGSVYEFAGDVSDGSGGVVAFRLTPADTNLLPGNYKFQIEWARNDGSVYIPLFGTVNVLDRIVV